MKLSGNFHYLKTNISKKLISEFINRELLRLILESKIFKKLFFSKGHSSKDEIRV